MLSFDCYICLKESWKPFSFSLQIKTTADQRSRSTTHTLDEMPAGPSGMCRAPSEPKKSKSDTELASEVGGASQILSNSDEKLTRTITQQDPKTNTPLSRHHDDDGPATFEGFSSDQTPNAHRAQFGNQVNRRQMICRIKNEKGKVFRFGF